MHYQSADSWSSYNNSTTTSTMSSSINNDGITDHVVDPAAVAYSIERLIERLASENAVVIFSISSCCMCHAIKRLFCGMGVNPTVYELDQDPTKGKDIEKALMNLLLLKQGTSSSSSSSSSVPVVFIGGKLVGPMDRVMASHINGSLVPLLKSAGALWL